MHCVEPQVVFLFGFCVYFTISVIFGREESKRQARHLMQSNKENIGSYHDQIETQENYAKNG